MSSPKLVNLIPTYHTGKWFTVSICVKENDPNEKPDVVAKFVSGTDALAYGSRLADLAQYTLVVVQ